MPGAVGECARAANSGSLLRPDSLGFVAAIGIALHGYGTGSFRRTRGAAFQDARSNPERFNLSLQSGDLRLEDGDLVFLLFYRVVYIGHLFFGLWREYSNN
jgi:hypothetical protein